MGKYRITNHATKEEIIVEANSAQEAAKKVGYRINTSEITDIGQPKLSGMTIEKAIEILSHLPNRDTVLITQLARDAVNLGIEALKLIQELRKWGVPRVNHTLLGETKDADEARE